MTKAVELTLGGTLKLLVREIEQAPTAFFTLAFDSFTITARGDDMAYTLPVDKQVRVKVSYVDAHGNPAQVDDVGWQSSDEGIARVWRNAENHFEAVIAPSGNTGQVQIAARADADMGEGTRELITTMDITVVAGEAVAGVIEPVGAPGNIPHPQPH